MKDGSLIGIESAGEGGDRVLKADRLEQLAVGIVFFQGPLIASGLQAHQPVGAHSFGRIHAATGGEQVLNVKAAILQIPTARPAGFLVSDPPQTKQAFLQHVLLQKWIAREFGDDLAQRVVSGRVFEQ